jgi:hypothetical protein
MIDCKPNYLISAIEQLVEQQANTPVIDEQIIKLRNRIFSASPDDREFSIEEARSSYQFCHQGFRCGVSGACTYFMISPIAGLASNLAILWVIPPVWVIVGCYSMILSHKIGKIEEMQAAAQCLEAKNEQNITVEELTNHFFQEEEDDPIQQDIKELFSCAAYQFVEKELELQSCIDGSEELLPNVVREFQVAAGCLAWLVAARENSFTRPFKEYFSQKEVLQFTQQCVVESVSDFPDYQELVKSHLIARRWYLLGAVN